MSEHEDEHFEQGESGPSLTYLLDVGSVETGSYMVFQGRPCKVVYYSTSKPGKYGYSKAFITGIDIFTGKKYENCVPMSHNVEVPNIKRSKWIVISVDQDKYLTLMDLEGNIRQDLKLPEETEDDNVLSDKIRASVGAGKDLTVTVMESMKIEKVTEMSEN